MKKILILMMAVLFAATALVSCGDKAEEASGDNEKVVSENVTEEAETENEEAADEIPEGWSYSPKKLIGAWEYQYEMTGEYYGYRFNEDGTIDQLYNHMNIPMGYYECREDGVHYSPDGETWDELVMVIKSQNDDKLVVDFNGIEEAYTRYDGEITSYMPDGWSYVEGTDEEIAEATS